MTRAPHEPCVLLPLPLTIHKQTHTNTITRKHPPPRSMRVRTRVSEHRADGLSSWSVWVWLWMTLSLSQLRYFARLRMLPLGRFACARACWPACLRSFASGIATLHHIHMTEYMYFFPLGAASHLPDQPRQQQQPSDITSRTHATCTQ